MSSKNPNPRDTSGLSDEEAQRKSTEIVNRARATIILDQPFFSCIMLKHPFEEDMSINAIKVTGSGRIAYNPHFVAGLTNKQMVFAIAHEILHYASGHEARRGTRDEKQWNLACDYWVNDTLERTTDARGEAMFELLPDSARMQGAADKTVEDIYAQLPPPDPNGDGNDQGQGNGKQQGKGKGKGGGSGNDNDPMQGDMDSEGSNDPAQQSENEANRKLDVAEAAQNAKMQGKLPGMLQKFAEETLESKTPWYEILERYMTERIMNDYTWRRPNRRFIQSGHYLPSIDGIGAMGPIVVQVDISGSISREEIRAYNGHLKRIVELCRPTKVHVIYTDTHVQRHEEFDKPEDMEINFYSGGGTDMRAGFDYVEEHDIEAECMVTLTDGYTPFPESTEIPSIWCISNTHCVSPTGLNVHFDLND